MTNSKLFTMTVKRWEDIQLQIGMQFLGKVTPIDRKPAKRRAANKPESKQKKRKPLPSHNGA